MSEQSLCEISNEVEKTKPKNILDKVLVGLFSLIVGVNSLLLTLVVAAAAAARYVFKADFPGYEEIAVLVGFWLYFMGAAYGAYNNTHVSADVIDAYFPEGTMKRILTVLRNAITVGVCGLFVYFGYEFFEFAFKGPLGNYQFQPRSMTWRIPFWTSRGAIFFGLIFMELYFFRNLVLSLNALIKGDKA